ncbi:MAG: hypothetical protein FWD57_07335 [Polyangiaceae bacterium]|nr:hypothetical protein [Polyangiaceae bacterium]
MDDVGKGRDLVGPVRALSKSTLGMQAEMVTAIAGVALVSAATVACGGGQTSNFTATEGGVVVGGAGTVVINPDNEEKSCFEGECHRDYFPSKKDPEADIDRLGELCGTQCGMIRFFGDTGFVGSGQGDPIFHLDLRTDSCYLFMSAVGEGVSKFSGEVKDPQGKYHTGYVGSTTMLVRICPNQSGLHILDVHAEGRGKYVVRGWKTRGAR